MTRLCPRKHGAESVYLGSETPGTLGHSTSAIPSTAIYATPCHLLSPPKWFSFSLCLIFQLTHAGTSRSPRVTDLLTYPTIFLTHQGQHGGVWKEGGEGEGSSLQLTIRQHE